MHLNNKYRWGECQTSKWAITYEAKEEEKIEFNRVRNGMNDKNNKKTRRGGFFSGIIRGYWIIFFLFFGGTRLEYNDNKRQQQQNANAFVASRNKKRSAKNQNTRLLGENDINDADCRDFSRFNET